MTPCRPPLLLALLVVLVALAIPALSALRLGGVAFAQATNAPTPATSSSGIPAIGSVNPIPVPSASASAPVPPTPPVPASLPPSASVSTPDRAPHSSPTQAHVRVHGGWPNSWLELRDVLQGGPWEAVCRIPCEQNLEVESKEVRVTAPGMTPTNAFRIDPGWGVAGLRVAGGSSSLRALGTGVLVGGLVMAAGGATVYGYGRFEEQQSLVTVGAIALVVSGVAVIGSLPLLSLGSSRVKDARGHTVAQREIFGRF